MVYPFLLQNVLLLPSQQCGWEYYFPVLLASLLDVSRYQQDVSLTRFHLDALVSNDAWYVADKQMRHGNEELEYFSVSDVDSF